MMLQNQIILVLKLHCFIDVYVFFNIFNITSAKKSALIVYHIYKVEDRWLESSRGNQKSQR